MPSFLHELVAVTAAAAVIAAGMAFAMVVMMVTANIGIEVQIAGQ